MYPVYVTYQVCFLNLLVTNINQTSFHWSSLYKNNLEYSASCQEEGPSVAKGNCKQATNQPSSWTCQGASPKAMFSPLIVRKPVNPLQKIWPTRDGLGHELNGEIIKDGCHAPFWKNQLRYTRNLLHLHIFYQVIILFLIAVILSGDPFRASRGSKRSKRVTPGVCEEYFSPVLHCY